jgi:hypothetical protein
LDAVQGGEAKSDNIAVDEIVDAVHTIQLCVDHQASLMDNHSSSSANSMQKTLVDDVLSFSKLDASMLSLAPR